MKDCRKCVCNTKVIPCGAKTDEECEKLYTSKLSVALDTFIDAVKTILVVSGILSFVIFFAYLVDWNYKHGFI